MTCSAAELAEPERSLKRLLLAAQDMVECRAAVDFLRTGNDIPGDVRRALETAAPVAYARPWGRTNTIGTLEDRWLPIEQGQLELHRRLIEVRNRLGVR